MEKVAVVLFNLGGPDRLDAVRPFLFNLFSDPAIIGLPQPLRWLVARMISNRRAPIAREIYQRMGGSSPLLPQTEAQAQALEQALGRWEGHTVRTFVAMRYWYPMTAETVAAVKAFAPDRVVLLPLYPQYSTTTSGSSLALWAKEARRQGLDVPTHSVCCWPTAPEWIEVVAHRVSEAVHRLAAHGEPRVLFSAHGLPKKVIASGDPYQAQVEQSCAAVVERLGMPGLDWVTCYQSRVGPLEWIGPATDDEIRRAGAEEIPVVVVPIAFVSEHSETLVELDQEYRELGEAAGVAGYARVATAQDDPGFIAGLARLVREAVMAGADVRPAGGERVCPQPCVRCPYPA